MTTPLPITFAALPTGFNAMSLFDQQFAASVNGAYFVTGSVPTAALADNAVTTAKIADSNVTSAKLATTGVAAGTYGNAGAVGQFTVNDKGQITSATSVAISAGSITTGLLPTANGGEANVATRSAMAALETTKNTVAYLMEAGRQGWFQWNSANLSAYVTIDTAQGIYVAPASAPTGASGAWVRVNAVPANVMWFGAKGDGSTDDLTAFQVAANLCQSIYVPSGFEYKISDGVQLSSNTTIYGDGIGSKITTTGTNKRILWANGKTNIVVKGLYLNGNLSGFGSTGGTSTGGDGVAFINCSYSNVISCIFANIGSTTPGTGFASCVWGYQLVSSLIRDNVFLGSNGGAVANNGADINCSYYCNRLEIFGNYSTSSQDSSIYVGAVGATQGDNDRNIITNNYAERADGSVTRSGILVPYAAKSVYTVISNNVMVNFPANGIYVSAGAAADPDAGGVTVTGNILMWSGGASYMTGISAGLYLSGYNGCTAVSNLIYKTGYERGGTKRTNDVPGIRVTNTSRRISCSSNVVRDSSSQGLQIINQGGSAMTALSFANNQFLNNVLGGILISVANAGSTIDGLSIVGGIIDQESNDYDGITFTQSSSGPTPTDVTISGVQVLGVSASTKYGLTTNMAGFLGWNVSALTLKNWTRGMSFGSGSVTDKDIGKGCVLSENYFDTCTTGIFANIGAGKFALHFGSTFRNCTNEGSDLGRILSSSRLGGGTFEIRKAAAPADGAWLVGDRLNYTVPTSGGFIGEVCTTAGSPGTWKTYGAIS